MVSMIKKFHKSSQTFPQVLYAYHLLDGNASVVVVDNLEDVPSSSKIVAVYGFQSIGNFSRSIKFELVDDKGE